jgi:molecular chaperone GrpE
MADQEWIVGENQTVPASPVAPEPPEPSGPLGALKGDRVGDAEHDPELADAELDDDGALEVAVAQRDEFLADLQRLQADFDNYRKRVMREQTLLVERAAERLVEDLLPVLDALDLAMTSVANLPADHDQVKKGIELTYAQLFGVLEKAGLERVDALGEPFDPNLHEAVMHVEEGEHDEPTVVDVMRAGYRLKGRTLRAAMVKVAK